MGELVPDVEIRDSVWAGVDLAGLKPDSLTKTSSIADAYWFAHQQSRDGWTHELDLRPGVETW